VNIQITRKDIDSARRVYWWLWVAPVLAVPCWLFNSSYSSNNLAASIFGTGLPLIFYIPVFLWAVSPNPYLKAHARQGVVLVALRFFFAVLADSNSAWGFLMCNAFLWLFGSLVGMVDAGNGRVWIGNIHAEIVNTPVKAQTPTTEKAQSTQSIEYNLRVFRTGEPSVREAAARRLEALGQVETF
jgi:hypothetical protein